LELESLRKKEISKSPVKEESQETLVNSNYPPVKKSARAHVPDVFDHQYVEYISGLKPPSSKYGLSGEKHTETKGGTKGKPVDL